MKNSYFLWLFAIFFWHSLSFGQTVLPYSQGAGATFGNSCETTINYLTQNQVGISATLTSSNYAVGTWSDGNFEYYVNGVLRGSGSGTQTIDLSEYKPITSIRLRKTDNDNWNQINLAVNVTSLNGFMPASGPTVSDVRYCKGATVSPLTATLTGVGATLKWFTSDKGEGYSATPPTPSSANVGTTSYWVSQADVNGSESVRMKINVVIDDVPSAPATAATVTYGQDDEAVALSATAVDGATLSWYTSVTGGTASTEAPTPQTFETGTVSYWVSQTKNNCESARAKIDVVVKEMRRIVFSGHKYAENIADCQTTVDYFTTCQKSVSALFSCLNSSYGSGEPGNFEYYVNGVLRGTGSGHETIDLTQYIPITSVKIKKTNQTQENYVGVMVNIASYASNGPAEAPTVAPVVFCPGANVTPLTATLSGTGSKLKWYDSPNGDFYTATPVTPVTEVGARTYWVAQADAAGCESERAQILVTISGLTFTVGNYSGMLHGSTYSGPFQWYKCDGMTVEPISGANTNMYTPKVKGSYALEVTNNGCTVRSSCVEVTKLKAYDHVYSAETTGPADLHHTLTLDNFSTCQDKVALHTNGFNWAGYETVNYSVVVNETNTIATGLLGEHDFDLTQYIPVTSVKLVGGGASYWITMTGSVSVTSLGTSMPDSASAVSTVAYCKGISASLLVAALTETGATLKWYMHAEGGLPNVTGITPTTDVTGTTSYWVSQADANGCESDRTAIQVIVGLSTAIINNSDVLTVAETGAVYKWMTCNNGVYADIPNAINQNYTVTAIGSYAVEVTKNGCVERSDCFEVTSLTPVLKAAEFDLENSVKLYPNPAIDTVVIDQIYVDGKSKLDVYDMSGRLLFSKELQKETNYVNVSGLNSGVYMFRISNDLGTVVKQVLKK